VENGTVATDRLDARAGGQRLDARLTDRARRPPVRERDRRLLLRRSDRNARSSHGPTQDGDPVRADPASAPAPRASALQARRIADVLLASSALAASAPVMLAVAVAVKLDDGGPLLFRQERLGLHGRPFTLLKVRTMVQDASSETHERYVTDLATGRVPDGGLFKLTDDPRVTRVGRWLRKLSLDEVPQFLNVLAGHMAVVGPRPALPYETALYAPHHFERFTVRPGITGLWQVSGRNRLGFLEMLELDAEYARRRSARLDLQILLLTPGALLGHSA
jgi:lipopolysaccharide/colanic/teichoic acid biosynthesis glycosyltransferase